VRGDGWRSELSRHWCRREQSAVLRRSRTGADVVCNRRQHASGFH